MDEFMTSAEVARLLGVGPTSVKRWADLGSLPCVRTQGRHRRFARGEVEKFRLARHEVREMEPAQIDEWIGLLDSECSPYEVHAALLRDRARLEAWWCVAEFVGAVLGERDRRGERGEIGVLRGQLAGERLARGLARCTESIAVPHHGPRALLVGAEGDPHTLGLRLGELVLRERGWNVLWGGCSVPSAEVVERVVYGDCDLVAISAHGRAHEASNLRAQVRKVGAACQEHDVQLVLGGRAPWPEQASDLPRFHRVHTFRELHELLSSLHG
ncbi:MAG: helix-turn-helix domain-containing protein [Planctomycetes bacterium]|nr:helix-turn-helix domain-containing protein [Planctomycetota bacterium]